MDFLYFLQYRNAKGFDTIFQNFAILLELVTEKETLKRKNAIHGRIPINIYKKIAQIIYKSMIKVSVILFNMVLSMVA